MKHFKTKLFALGGLTVLAAATLLAPNANAGGKCPNWYVECPDGARRCEPTTGQDGTCSYEAACLNCEGTWPELPLID
jgi:hypothetical protein